MIPAAARLKREDHIFTRHDSVFSPWKELIGPSDWEDYDLRKDGCSRYRTDNLPVSSSPGLYELALVLFRRRGRRITSRDVIPVYVGKSDNVRDRLQDYGRDGSHLDRGRSISLNYENGVGLCFLKGPGLFKEVFSKGWSIAFRWAEVDSKKNAEEIEAQLLSFYDYAWNKDCNGTRRRAEILGKLDKFISAQSYAATMFDHLFHWKPYIFGRKRVGIKIDGHKPIENLVEKLGHSSDKWKPKLHFSLFRHYKLKSHLALRNIHTDATNNSNVASKETENHLCVCGVWLEDGSICLSSPVIGRKRCMLHKGIRVNQKTKFAGKQILAKGGSDRNSYFLTEREPDSPLEVRNEVDINGTSSLKEMNKSMPIEGDVTVCGKVMPELPGTSISSDLQSQEASRTKVHGVHQTNDSKCRTETDVNPRVDRPICGVNLCSGFVCQKKPVKGRKRCSEHKGMRIDSLMAGRVVSPSDKETSICGVNLCSGLVCQNNPVKGRKRCNEHKGMRIGRLMAGTVVSR